MSRRGTPWHPWRHLRHRYPHIVVVFEDIDDPEILGYTDFAGGRIVLDRSLSQVERRCTLTHELEHVHRGPLPDDDVLIEREELGIDRAAANRLVTLRDLIDALLLSDHEHDVADELWVDVPTLRTRIANLAADERAAIDDRLHQAERWHP